MVNPRLACAAGLLAAAMFISPALARPASDATRLFLHIDAGPGASTSPAVLSLSTTDHVDRGNGVGQLHSGVLNEALERAGQPTQRDVFPAVDGVPLRLDARRPVTGLIAMRTWELSAGVVPPLHIGGGLTTIEVTLGGTLASGDTAVIGEQTIEYLVTPLQDTYRLDVEMPIDAGLQGEKVRSLWLETRVRGASVLSGHYELDDPASFIEVPTAPTPRRT